MTAEEHRDIAHSSHLAGNICAGVSLALAVLCVARALTGQWEAIAGLAVAAWLLWAANREYAVADQHHSHAAALEENHA